MTSVRIDAIDFSSNNYLGLANSPLVLEAGYAAAKLYGSGSTGSRLLAGNSDLFENFEKQIARDQGTETALLFNSGFDANSGVLASIVNQDGLVIFDKLNHASMYQGVALSGAKLLRYNHLDYEMAERLLRAHAAKSRTIIIASETVFGMDGDRADIKILAELSAKYNTILYLDEAHAVGLYGKDGYGLSTDFTFDSPRTIVMGTLSKAMGSSGAYVACDEIIKEFIGNKCKYFLYSTALSPFCIGTTACSWKISKIITRERQALTEASNKLRKALNGLG
jgi:8-amino-7-oxononanoate synthase